MGWLEQAMKLATGGTTESLSEEGKKVYPEENPLLNNQGHRLAARRMTERVGPLSSQVAGLANEGYEALNRKAVSGSYFGDGYGADTVEDLKANARGMRDAMVDPKNNAWVPEAIRAAVAKKLGGK